MELSNNYESLAAALRDRRQKLATLTKLPIVLWSGGNVSRNYPANTFPFRASSHFLYFAGFPLENAAINLDRGRLELFIDNAPPGSTLWHGEMPKREEIAEKMGADAVFPLADLERCTAGAATIAVQDYATQLRQAQLLKRPLPPPHSPQGIDLDLTKAIISLRLIQDAAALAEVRQAIAVTIEAHKAGMTATAIGKTEAGIRAVMESVIIAQNMTFAYPSIVTVRGEVLHNNQYHHPLQKGNLLLADVGAETAMGWASDVTRTWPVSGKFSPTQRDIYDVVLAARDACIAKVRTGIKYRYLHLLAAQTITEGLVDLGIFRGNPNQLVEMNTHALFFVHGIGHLIGLDVHDMEDFGDLAGYEEGRERDTRFGWKFLRLDRTLRPGMLVSIEPGFYQVPAVLNNADMRLKYKDMVNWDRLEQFADVRGIRIEDDVLVTAKGAEVLTANLPTRADEIEQLVKG